MAAENEIAHFHIHVLCVCVRVCLSLVLLLVSWDYENKKLKYALLSMMLIRDSAIIFITPFLNNFPPQSCIRAAILVFLIYDDGFFLGTI